MKRNARTAKPIGLCFLIQSSKDFQYAQLRIRIQAPEEYGTQHRDLAEITWQSDRSDFSKWYGLHVRTDFDGYRGNIASRLTAAAKVVSRLMETAEDTDPLSILAALETMKLPRVSYDGRLSKNITPDQFTPGKRYMDAYDNYGFSEDGCAQAAVAETEEDAQRAIQQKWAETLANGGSYRSSAERFAAWINAGRPVMIDRYSNAPEFPTMAEILFQPEQTPAEVAA